MARTYRHLWTNVIDWEHMVESCHKCRRRKRFKRPAIAFDFDWETQLLKLQQDLRSDTYEPGAYRHFHITDPKPRKISAAPFRDRVVHHALVGVLEPIYERRFIDDSYACRQGKGTHRAILRAQSYMRRYPWCLKTDIVRFFPNIDHTILLSCLSRSICDERILNLVQIILHSGAGVLREEASLHWFAGDNLLAPLRPRGLPIGNLTSQFFANVYLDVLDHFIKEELRVCGYVRYADDLLLFGESKQKMWSIHRGITQFLESLRLKLHVHKTHVQPSKRGVSFLGFRVFADQKRLLQTSIQRFKRRARRLRWRRKRGEISFVDIQASVQAWLAHLKHANSTGLKRNLLRNTKF